MTTDQVGVATGHGTTPAGRLVGVVLSTDTSSVSEALPHPLADLWTTVYAALG